MLPLPIDAHLGRIRSAVAAARATVIVAAPGAGKTTRVPPVLAADGPVIVLQPRRVAARAMARRIAEEQGWTLGREVGWHVRFERRFRDDTRVLLATEGILTARLRDDPLASGFRTIVLDEFHERSIHADLGLALARQAWLARDDLRVVVMSATIDPAPVSRFLGDCPVIEIAGAPHPLEIEYAPGASVAEAAAAMWARSRGTVLCFLPGAPEIRRAEPEVRRAVPAADVLILHGGLPPDEQDRAIAAAAARRLILATNLAETSLTVPGVDAVVDTGLHKVARYDAARAIDALALERISQASADQRAGRAARLGPGRVCRLWDPRDRLRPQREPDVARIDLAGTVLDLAAWGAAVDRFDWFEPPPPAALESAADLLQRLGALETGRLTPLGRTLQRLPLPPRLARILVAAGGARTAARACALLSERQPLPPRHEATSCDLLAALDDWSQAPPHLQQVARQLEALASALVESPPLPGQAGGRLAGLKPGATTANRPPTDVAPGFSPANRPPTDVAPGFSPANRPPTDVAPGFSPANRPAHRRGAGLQPGQPTPTDVAPGFSPARPVAPGFSPARRGWRRASARPGQHRRTRRAEDAARQTARRVRGALRALSPGRETALPTVGSGHPRPTAWASAPKWRRAQAKWRRASARPTATHRRGAGLQPGQPRRGAGLQPGQRSPTDVAPGFSPANRPPTDVAPSFSPANRSPTDVAPGFSPAIDEIALRRAIFAGYPDRLAQRRGAGSARVRLSSGTGGVVGPESGVRDGEYLVALDLVAPTRAGETEARIRLASRVEPEWIVPTGQEIVCAFDAVSGRVRAVQRTRYDALVLAEHPQAPDPHEAAAILADAWLAAPRSERDAQFLRRLAFAGLAVDLPALVRAASLTAATLDAIDPAAHLPFALARELDRRAPLQLVLPTGRRLRLEYRDEGSVAAAVKLQDLFGTAETPVVGPDRVPVLLSLLAPNGRPVQTTRDLPSFWSTTYAEVRKELRGRYPRHAWPEDPWTASPRAR